MNRMRMFSCYISIVLLCVAFLTPTSSTKAENQLTFKYSVAWPKGHFSTDTAYRIAELVKKKTNGQIIINVFPSQQLFKASKHFDVHREGLIDFSCTPAAYFSGFEPMGEYETMPGMFPSIPEGKKVYNPFDPGNEPVRIINEVMAKHNMKIIACNWMDQVFASTKPVLRPRDLKGLTLRVAGKCVSAGYQSAGASLIAMPSAELYIALQRKTVEACITSPDTILTTHIYEVTNCLNLYSPNSIPNEHWISLSTWDRLTPEHQRILMECAKIADEEALATHYKQREQVMKTYKDRKGTVHEPTIEEVKAWNEAIRPPGLVMFKQLTGKDGERFLSAVDRLR